MTDILSPVFKTIEGQNEYLLAYDRVLSQWPVAHESIYIPTNFGQTHVIVCGPEKAPPLILLHVMTFSSTMWFPNIEELSKSYRTYAVDTMGDVGRSIPHKRIGSRFEYIEWLKQIIDQLHVGKASIIGESFGAWLALNLGIYAPAIVDHIVLLSPAAGFLLYSLQADFQFGRVLFPRFNSERYWEWVVGNRHKVDGNFAKQLSLARHYKMQGWPIIPMALSDGELRQMRVPTLLLIGEYEVTNNPRRALQRAENLLGNVETKLVPNVGHIMNMEEPEIVDRLILNFLQTDNDKNKIK
jgi:pimeloyl-ACP methyl ester carboxylesterase